MDAVGYSQRSVFVWGLPEFKTYVNSIPGLIFNFKIPGVDQMIMRMPPVVAKPTAEAAVYTLNWVSATGTGILLAAIISAFVMGYSVREMVRVYWETIKMVRYSLLTIAAMLALGFVTKFSGVDATMGLTFAMTGMFTHFSERCWDGWELHSQGLTHRPTCFSAVYSASPLNRSVSAQRSCVRQTAPVASWAR